MLLAALFVLMQLSELTAYASCGDYLGRHPASEMTSVPLRHLHVFGDTNDPGPSCHQDHSIPTPPVTPVVLRGFPDAILVDLVRMSRTMAPADFSRVRSQLTAPDAARIFRPPRVA